MEVLHSFHGTLKNLLPQGTLQLFLPPCLLFLHSWPSLIILTELSAQLKHVGFFPMALKIYGGVILPIL